MSIKFYDDLIGCTCAPDDKYADISITFNNNEVHKYHKHVLKTSSFFNAIINGNFKESYDNNINLTIDKTYCEIYIKILYHKYFNPFLSRARILNNRNIYEICEILKTVDYFSDDIIFGECLLYFSPPLEYDKFCEFYNNINSNALICELIEKYLLKASDCCLRSNYYIDIYALTVIYRKLDYMELDSSNLVKERIIANLPTNFNIYAQYYNYCSTNRTILHHKPYDILFQICVDNIHVVKTEVSLESVILFCMNNNIQLSEQLKSKITCWRLGGFRPLSVVDNTSKIKYVLDFISHNNKIYRYPIYSNGEIVENNGHYNEYEQGSVKLMMFIHKFLSMYPGYKDLQYPLCSISEIHPRSIIEYIVRETNRKLLMNFTNFIGPVDLLLFYRPRRIHNVTIGDHIILHYIDDLYIQINKRSGTKRLWDKIILYTRSSTVVKRVLTELHKHGIIIDRPMWYLSYNKNITDDKKLRIWEFVHNLYGYEYEINHKLV